MLQVMLDIKNNNGHYGDASAGFVGRCSVPELRGDFSLNAANALSAASLLQVGLARVTPTHDLNGEQLLSMADTLVSFLSSFNSD